jgi:hypothetical protein
LHSQREEEAKLSELLKFDEAPKDLYTDPEHDTPDKLVWSLTKTVGPYSFMDAKVLEQLRHFGEAPPPTYLKYNQDIKPDIEGWNKDVILRGWRNHNGTLICTD